jgi:hypothetical protein
MVLRTRYMYDKRAYFQTKGLFVWSRLRGFNEV